MALRSHRVVVLPYLDHCLRVIALRGLPFPNLPARTIMMRGGWRHQALLGTAPPTLRNRLAWRVERAYLTCLLRQPRIQIVGSVDPLFATLAARTLGSGGKIRYLPDPFLGLPPERGRSGVARKKFGLNSQDFVVLVFGGLAPRKGIEQLVAALRRIDSRRFKALLVGRVHPTVGRFLDESASRKLRLEGRLVVVDEYVSREVEAQAFRAADAVWLGYSGHYTMSGVLVSAARYGLPTVACDEGSIGWLTKRYGLGEVVDPKDALSVAAAICRLDRDDTLRATRVDHATRFARAHDPDVAFAAFFD